MQRITPWKRDACRIRRGALGSFLLEIFFSIPGLGREVIESVNRSDFPVIKAITVYLAIITMSVNLLVDVLYRVADPRVSFK